MQSPDISNIANEYGDMNSRQVSYLNFIKQLRLEFDILGTLAPFYQGIRDAMEFISSVNLYDIFY